VIDAEGSKIVDSVTLQNGVEIEGVYSDGTLILRNSAFDFSVFDIPSKTQLRSLKFYQPEWRAPYVNKNFIYQRLDKSPNSSEHLKMTRIKDNRSTDLDMSALVEEGWTFSNIQGFDRFFTLVSYSLKTRMQRVQIFELR
jgi:hypothetical protein